MMNALYGAVANIYFQYYVNEMAEAITTSGQVSIKWAGNVVNDYMNNLLKTKNVDYIQYIDTDSIAIKMDPLVQKVFGTSDISNTEGENFLNKVFKDKIEPLLKRGYEELSNNMGAMSNEMIMKREKITNKAIYLSPKRYIMSVLNNEGVHYTDPKISVTGVESVRSSTPQICRDKMEESFKVFLNETEDDAQSFIAKFKEEFKQLPVNEIAKISGTDDIEKFADKQTIYKKRSGCPIHVRGALLYNHFLVQKGLETKYEKIRSGDKVKFIYLKTPNPLRENVISFMGEIPKEFGLEKYIDHEIQFEKVFLKPIETILTAIGWTSEKLSTLDSFFN